VGFSWSHVLDEGASVGETQTMGLGTSRAVTAPLSPLPGVRRKGSRVRLRQ
jgi:hypothetical protein